MNGYIDAINAGGFVTVSFSNISYPVYAAVVYFGSDGNGRTGQITDGTTTYGYSTFSNDPNGGGGFDPSTDYVLTTATGAARPEANYAVFAGLTASSVTFDIIRGSGNSGIHAVQIISVPVPEPSSLILIGSVGCLMVVVRYVRRRYS